MHAGEALCFLSSLDSLKTRVLCLEQVTQMKESVQSKTAAVVSGCLRAFLAKLTNAFPPAFSSLDLS